MKIRMKETAVGYVKRGRRVTIDETAPNPFLAQADANQQQQPQVLFSLFIYL
jgi:hypothetical protein